MLRDDDYELVHNSATTNTTPGSKVSVAVNMAPICSNMTNKEFRESIVKSRDDAVLLIRKRIDAVAKWDKNEQARAKRWFGRSGDSTRAAMHQGLPKLLRAMQELKPENIIRWDEQKQRNITCEVVPDNGSTDAAVCKPDSHRRIIAIYSHFCTSPRDHFWRGCQVLTLIHECTHYTDVFDSTDDMYGVSVGLSFWAQSNPDQAIWNADSIACYIGFND
ncbi:M35 family metallo-endopeptidase [Burkholderia ubonensis]|uniref:M35 family metallo-endopeptidase n=1 Tax=Burkholderia ubonensis TaxID=101571 RepID=UPI0009B47085|nr:M35 family metallo-endopeptidase [Burkholderia ubonensis]